MAIAAQFLIPPTEKRHPYLAVSERPFAEDDNDRLPEIAWTSGQLLRECGAKEFLIKPSIGSDIVPYSLVRIVPDNDDALHCVFERATREGFPLHVQMLTEREAKIF
ncbi:MAG: hypothetical protein H6918_04250 [Sphingomonadaceae bacterium]|nr:hypothetical protein [Sphingomonadaceae bacterium]